MKIPKIVKCVNREPKYINYKQIYITEQVLFQDEKLQNLNQPDRATINIQHTQVDSVHQRQLSLEYQQCVTSLLITSAVLVWGLGAWKGVEPRPVVPIWVSGLTPEP